MADVSTVVFAYVDSHLTIAKVRTVYTHAGTLAGHMQETLKFQGELFLGLFENGTLLEKLIAYSLDGDNWTLFN